MASKYLKKFKVPNNFENILSDFAKEILRNQPKDIVDFGIEYFKGLESSGKFDYKDKGENRPENYKRPENQQPNIINAPNNLEISREDNNRIQRSMDKIDRINGDPKFKVIKTDRIIRNGEENGQRQEENQSGGRYGAINDNEEHKKDYDDWFTRHSLDKQAINYQPVKKGVDENLKRNEMGYNTWFNNHSERSNEKSQSGEMRKEEGHKGGEGYDDWFTRHSLDKQVIDYKAEKEAPDENLKRNEMGYKTWFNNHSVRSNEQSQSGEIRYNEGEGYDEWFERHSRDRLAIDYKPGKKVYDIPARCEEDYATWFENHSKLTNKNS